MVRTLVVSLVLVLAPLAAFAQPSPADVQEEIAAAEAAMREAEAAGAAVYATSLYNEAQQRLASARQNATASSSDVRSAAQLDALEARLAAEAAEAKAAWVGQAREANDLREDIGRFGGDMPVAVIVEPADMSLSRGTTAREHVAYAEALVGQAKGAGVAGSDPDAIRRAEELLESARRIARANENSDTASFLAYQAEMLAREAWYEMRQREVEGLLPGIRLERTRLAQVASERQAAQEREERQRLQTEAAQLREQLERERQSREVERAELERLRAELEANQRRIREQLEADRAARIQAEQDLQRLAEAYERAIAENLGAAEVAALRRQIEDQQAAIQAITERERTSERTMAEQLRQLREDLAAERLRGMTSADELAAREDELNRRAAELERLRVEREDAVIRLNRMEEVLRAQIAENEARLRAAEERAAEAERALQEQRERIQQMEQRLAEIAETRRDERGFIVTLPGIFFDTGKSQLKPGALDTLRRIAEELRQNAALTLLVEGHTDSVGSEEMNQQLSEARAASVRDFLAENGIDAARITTVGRGESSPVASNDTAAGRQQNRRVEVVIQQARE
ncbi:MAG: OmpA family protein [Thermoanaerobaculia bacterium]